MLKKEFCGKEIPTLGLGLMRLPVKNDEIDYDKTKEMVDYAHSKGIRYFDTAYPYHNGQSEIFIGKALKDYNRNDFYLASKMPIWACKENDDVRKIFFEQLKKCQVEYFDFYLCHAMSLERHNEYLRLDAYNTLVKLKEEGYIKNLGFSFHDLAANIVPILDTLDWDFCQIQLNYLDWTMQDAKRQYEEITKRNIGVVVMEPVRGGALANVCDEAKEILGNPASWALRFAASLPNVKIVLSGMSNMDQLVDNINTFTNFEYLSDSDRVTLEKARQAILGNKFIPCTGCRYCMPCPFGVNIPRVFSLYNQYQIDKNQEKFLESYQKLEKERGSSCKSCKACMKHCPQGINIPDELGKIELEIK